MRAQSGEFRPVLAAIGGPEHRRVFNACIHLVGIRQRWFKVPYTLELPRMWRAVVPLVRARYALVRELVADRRPRFSAVIGPLYHLAKPARGLRSVDPVRVYRRALHVVDLPPGEVRPF